MKRIILSLMMLLIAASCAACTTDKTVNSIEVAGNPAKMEYIIGETLDLSGGKIKINYSGGTSENIDMTDPSVTHSGFSSDTVGEKTVTLTYKEKTATLKVNVEVSLAAVSKIDIVSNPTKLVYSVGESLDLTGGSIKVTYADEKTETLDMKNERVASSGFSSAEAGDKTVTLTYKQKTVTFTVTVDGALASIQIEKNPTKESYIIGETLDLTGGKITVKYADSADVTLDMTDANVKVTGFDSDTDGDKLLTVTYRSKTATFSVTVGLGPQLTAIKNLLTEAYAFKDADPNTEDMIALIRSYLELSGEVAILEDEGTEAIKAYYDTQPVFETVTMKARFEEISAKVDISESEASLGFLAEFLPDAAKWLEDDTYIGGNAEFDARIIIIQTALRTLSNTDLTGFYRLAGTVYLDMTNSYNESKLSGHFALLGLKYFNIAAGSYFKNLLGDVGTATFLSDMTQFMQYTFHVEEEDRTALLELLSDEFYFFGERVKALTGKSFDLYLLESTIKLAYEGIQVQYGDALLQDFSIFFIYYFEMLEAEKRLSAADVEELTKQTINIPFDDNDYGELPSMYSETNTIKGHMDTLTEGMLYWYIFWGEDDYRQRTDYHAFLKEYSNIVYFWFYESEDDFYLLGNNRVLGMFNAWFFEIDDYARYEFVMYHSVADTMASVLDYMIYDYFMTTLTGGVKDAFEDLWYTNLLSLFQDKEYPEDSQDIDQFDKLVTILDKRYEYGLTANEAVEFNAMFGDHYDYFVALRDASIQYFVPELPEWYIEDYVGTWHAYNSEEDLNLELIFTEHGTVYIFAHKDGKLAFHLSNHMSSIVKFVENSLDSYKHQFSLGNIQEGGWRVTFDINDISAGVMTIINAGNFEFELMDQVFVFDGTKPDPNPEWDALLETLVGKWQYTELYNGDNFLWTIEFKDDKTITVDELYPEPNPILSEMTDITYRLLSDNRIRIGGMFEDYYLWFVIELRDGKLVLLDDLWGAMEDFVFEKVMPELPEGFEQFLGTWKGTHDNKEYTIVFNNDGTITMLEDGGAEFHNITFVITGTSIKINFTYYEYDDPDFFTFSLTGNTITCTDDNWEGDMIGAVLTLEGSGPVLPTGYEQFIGVWSAFLHDSMTFVITVGDDGTITITEDGNAVFGSITYVITGTTIKISFIYDGFEDEDYMVLSLSGNTLTCTDDSMGMFMDGVFTKA